MQSKAKSPITNPELQQRIRRRQLRNWLILVGAVALVIAVVITIVSCGSSGRVVSRTLPCYAHQDVTIFQDGVLYYDGESIHFVNAGGGVEWTYPVGAGASYSVSDSQLIIWAGRQLFIVDANGKPSYNQAMDDTIIMARIGGNYAAVVTGGDLTSTLHVRNLQGDQIDQEVEDYEGMLILDCGFYGESDEYMWVMSLDIYNTSITTLINTYQVGQMNTGVISISDHLAYKVLYENNKLHVFTTQQMYTYDYRGVQDVNNTMLVYGWQLLDHDLPSRGAARMLLAPTEQTTNVQSISELRLLADPIDRRYTLPASCVGAAISEDDIYAISSDSLYVGTIDSQRFTAYPIQLPDERSITGFVGLTDNGYAIVSSGNEIYSVSLP